VSLARDLNLDDMLFKYGVRVNPNLILDLQAAPLPFVVGYTGTQPQQRLIPWYYYPLIFPSSDHPIVRNLDAIRCEFVSSIDTIESKIKRSSGTIYPLGYDKFTDRIYGNKSFLLNCIDYMMDDSGLISARTKQVKLRLLDKTKLASSKDKIGYLNVSVPVVLVI